MPKTLRVGMVGYRFMGKAHSNAWRQAPHFFPLKARVEMHTICGRDVRGVESARDQLGWKNASTDWRALVESPEIDIVDINTPNDSHAEIAIAAARAGKHILCEKPLGLTVKQCEEMLDAVKKARVVHMVCHNYRRIPAIVQAKKMIDDGSLGEIYHYRARYAQDWIVDPNFPLVWRLQKEIAGSGTHGDINAHIIDLGRYLLGEFDEVCGTLHTFIKERPIAGEIDANLGAKATQEMGQVTVDDAAMFLAKFKNGALGTFEASRFAVGRKNYNRFEINGSGGSLVFNLERMNELEFFDNSVPEETHGFTTIQVTEGSHPYAGHYWPVAHIIGYGETFTNLLADAFTNMAEGKPISPDFVDGYENQRVLDAVERSSESRSWISL